ncbi:hypothetical protein BS78_K176500 [Paspalum vaginatum]|uniref:Uncharacterized protein n=1 Tax=Paspalum vaginatum TaxID=158149 RepID=A0A9W7XBR8_9POAL|nr:hypothetical protein BS78_K176500 [Paspalum vaginatum]
MNSNEEHTPTQPNEYSDAEHHQQKAQIESSQEEVEMEEDYPLQQENPSFVQLCASLFPSNQRSTFRGRHSLFYPRRRAPLKESPLHAAMAAIMEALGMPWQPGFRARERERESCSPRRSDFFCKAVLP